MTDIIDDEALGQIKTHIAEGIQRSERHRMYLEEDEDSITGSFLDNLLQAEWKHIPMSDRSITRWKIIVHKARGRGPNALEKYTGADGIIQLHVFDSKSRKILRKGLMFQAKKGEESTVKALEQTTRMENLAKKGSAVFTFNRSGYQALAGNDFLEGNLERQVSLEYFFNNRFLKCEVGVRNLYYDYYRRKQLVLPHDIIQMPLDEVNHVEIYIQTGR